MQRDSRNALRSHNSHSHLGQVPTNPPLSKAGEEKGRRASKVAEGLSASLDSFCTTAAYPPPSHSLE